MVSDCDNTLLDGDRVCAPCGEDSYKPEVGDTQCAKCPDGYRAHDNRLSCYAYKCSHVTCQHESHTCSRFNTDDTVRNFLYRDGNSLTNVKWNKEECDGSVHRSTRVFHSGVRKHVCRYRGQYTTAPHSYQTDCPLEELTCAKGHKCGMGVVSGDRTKCECKPTHAVPDWPPRPTRLDKPLACPGGKVWSSCAGCDIPCSGRPNTAGCESQCKQRCACPPGRPYWHDVGVKEHGGGTTFRCLTQAQCKLLPEYSLTQLDAGWHGHAPFALHSLT